MSVLPTLVDDARVSAQQSNLAKRTSIIVGIAVLYGYLALILSADKQWTVLALLVAGAAALFLSSRLGWIQAAGRSFSEHEAFSSLLAVVGIIGITIFFRSSPFVLFLLATILMNMTACMGLNIQFGFAGMLNFAGASMLGIGAYSAAIAGQLESMPAILLLPLGGLSAALIGSVLLPPMLRTRGHYSAVITIAFALLFLTLLDSFQPFGGSQGLAVRAMTIFGWNFAEPLVVGGTAFAFYANYVLLASTLTVCVFVLVRRIERSWIGLTLDAVRSDETASACFGISITKAKIFAFTAGNFIIGMAGALYALMLGYIAPSNFSFGDSLILVTIILLGGLGSIWGTVITTVVVLVLPERLQAIQEYRLLIYSLVVLIVLMFVPKGLIPRPARRYFSVRGKK
jgi:ABC-type branched-subunit amino acid transport system permease subunit